MAGYHCNGLRIFFPYFIIGLIARKYNLLDLCKKVDIFFCISLFILCPFIIYTIGIDFHKIIWLEDQYSSHDCGFSPIILCGCKLVQMVVSMGFSTCMISCLSNIKKPLKINNLFFYIFHLWLVRPLAAYIVVALNISSNILSAILVSLIVILLLILLQRIKFLNKILNPIELFTHRNLSI